MGKGNINLSMGVKEVPPIDTTFTSNQNST